LESKAEALVNTVNTVGIMGKGIALQFKNEFAHNYKVYREAYEAGELAIGRLLITEEESLLHGKRRSSICPQKQIGVSLRNILT